MRFIPTRLHGMLDYTMGVILIAAPWLLSFADNTAAQWVPVLLGAGAILYSLVTDYDFSLARLLPMRGHLTLDVVSGLLLALSPWLFGFHDRVYLPHLIFGLLEVGAGLMTDPRYRTMQELHDHKMNPPGRPHGAM